MYHRADADLSLWTKRLPPKDAFEDQVVWITGASQASPLSTVTLFAAHTCAFVALDHSC